MKVFISWSGEFSKKLASEIKNWIEQCIQSVEAFVSSEDIEKGDTWSTRLTNELSDTNYGIVCLTSENVSAPWIHFEAGALSKMVDSRVSAIATDIQVGDIKGPLSRFQNTKLEEQDMLQLLQSINSAIEKNGEKSLTTEKLEASFKAFWPSFNEKIKAIIEEHKTLPAKKQTTKAQINSESLDELLQLIRNQSAILSDPSKLIPIDYLIYAFENMGSKKENNIVAEIIFDYATVTFRMLRDTSNERNIEFTEEYFRGLCMLLKDISHCIEGRGRSKIRRLLDDIYYYTDKNSTRRII